MTLGVGSQRAVVVKGFKSLSKKLTSVSRCEFRSFLVTTAQTAILESHKICVQGTGEITAISPDLFCYCCCTLLFMPYTCTSPYSIVLSHLCNNLNLIIVCVMHFVQQGQLLTFPSILYTPYMCKMKLGALQIHFYLTCLYELCICADIEVNVRWQQLLHSCIHRSKLFRG